MTARETLIMYSLYYDGDCKKIYDSICNRTLIEYPDSLLQRRNAIKSNIVTLLDEDYPEWLKNVYMPPAVLYYYGDISLIKDINKNIGVIGSRKCSPYGERVTREIVSSICDSFNIVSGLASGIDTIGLETAYNNKGKVIAVLGNGIDICYPSDNYGFYKKIKQNGLVISEYPSDSNPSKDKFPLRNRIIAALSGGLLVTEAKKKSGTMITVSYALALGSNIMCVPERCDVDSGCNQIIKDGGFLVENADDVIAIMNGE